MSKNLGGQSVIQSYFMEQVLSLIWPKSGEGAVSPCPPNFTGSVLKVGGKSTTPIFALFSVFACLVWYYCSTILLLYYYTYAPLPKGRLISKWFFGVVDFLQKTNENKSTWGIIVVKLNLFVRFLEEIDDPKKPFRN